MYYNLWSSFASPTKHYTDTTAGISLSINTNIYIYIFPPHGIHLEAKRTFGKHKCSLRPCSIMQYYWGNLMMPSFVRFFVPVFFTELLDAAFQLGETKLLTSIHYLLFVVGAFDTKVWWPLSAVTVVSASWVMGRRYYAELITLKISISSSASKIKGFFWPLFSHASLLHLLMSLHFTKENMKPNLFVFSVKHSDTVEVNAAEESS